MKKKNIRIRSSVIYLICLIFVLIFSFMTFIFFKKYNHKNVAEKITYHSIDNSSFDVYYSGSSLVNGKTKEDSFIRKYTDYIDINFNYLLNFSDIVDGAEETLVKVTLLVYAPNSDTKIWKSDTEYLIPSKKTEYQNAGQFKFNNKVTIDYKKYLNLYERFKEESSIVSNAKISVEFVSSSIASYKSLPKITKTDNITYDIPLSDATFGISKNSNISSEEKTLEKIVREKEQDIYMVFICIYVFIIISLIIICIIRYIGDKKRNGDYKNKLNKILKSYDNIIVNIEILPELNGKNITNVTSFEELLDAQYELRIPINYCETVENKESKFIIISNDMVWIYTLRKEGKYE